jgi:hypothetical protein
MEFLSIEHTPAKSANSHSSKISARLDLGILEVLHKNELPIKFSLKRILGDEVFYETLLNPGMWMEHPWFEGCYLELKTNTGKILHRLDWHPLTHGTTSDVMFYLWSLQNPLNCGIVIGSNDGTYGEFLIPFLERNIGEITMVEASDRIFDKLKQKYNQFFNVRFINKLITPGGGETSFYELPKGSPHGELGFINSTKKEMVEIFNKNDIVEIKKDSISICDLILQSGYSNKDYWLMIDTEGLDADLINSLDFSKINKPKIIIWERGNYGDIHSFDNSYAIPHLEKNGYKIYSEKSENNIFAILE